METLAPSWHGGWPLLRPRTWLNRLVPSRRSLAIGLGILAFTLGGYLLARETSLFAIDRIEVHGGSAPVARQVRQALASLSGRPLVGLDGSAVLQKVDALPTVVSASYDRDFPHTLRITVVPERPAAILRRGPDSWLVSSRGRMMERLSSTALPKLPRIWISTHTPVQVGGELAASGDATVAHAVGLAGAFAARIASASYTDGALVLRLRSGLQLLLGDAGDVKLKLAVAQRVLTMLPSGSTFLDVGIPGRPVSGTGSPDTSTQQSSTGG
ncbi:MAG TPA: FtsQ-type POTRA domain-containing protein [Gaiellaceae bacterium]|nr:FtsQ-type POTRA domain-containing protein [Gaiellaceae bacterium]